MISDSFVVKKEKTKQRKVNTWDSNPVLLISADILFVYQPARLITHLECDENEKREKSVALLIAIEFSMTSDTPYWINAW